MGWGNSQRRRGAAPRHYKLPPPGPGLLIRQTGVAYGDGSPASPDAGQDTILTRVADAPHALVSGDAVLTRADGQRYKIPIYNLTTGQPLPDVTGEGAVVEAHHVVARRQPQKFDLPSEPFRPAQGRQRHRLHWDFDV